MQSFRFIVLLVVSLMAGVMSISRSQSPANTSNWETLRPEGEEFSVLMPKGSTVKTGKEPYHKMELNTRFYISQTQNGPVFAVASLSGIKSNPAMYTEMQRVNSYVDAFKKLFTPKISPKPVVTRLTFLGPKTLQNNPGREYAMIVGDLSGTVHAFATRKRFYAVVYLNSKKNEQLQEEFLSSFVLPERFEAPPENVAKSAAPAANPTPPATEATAETSSTSEKTANGTDETKPADATPPAEPGAKRPIKAGLLNSKALSLPKPLHPPEAREVTGTVAVEVNIDEMGNVISAHAISGPLPLQQAAVTAALQAKFSQTLLMGEPVKVTGVVTYTFTK